MIDPDPAFWTTTIVSVRDANGNGNSLRAAISGAGGFVVFTSTSTNIATDADGNPVTDANGALPDVFRADILFGGPTIEIVSLNNAAPPAQSTFGRTNFTTGDTWVGRAVSDDGCRVVFVGAPCDWVGSSCGTLNCLCPQPGGNCFACLVGSTSPVPQVYVRDMCQIPPRTYRVSRVWSNGFEPANASCLRASITSDGAGAAFTTLGTNLPLDTDSFEDVFVLDWGVNAADIDNPANNPIRASLPMGGAASNGTSTAPMLRGGGLVAFESAATNLVAGDTNGVRDVFVSKVGDPGVIVRRFSLSMPAGAILLGQGNGNSTNPDIGVLSFNGTDGVVYESVATNLVTGDTNAVQDIFESRGKGFKRGDADANGMVDPANDGEFLCHFLFAQGDPPPCFDAADSNDDGQINSTDCSIPPIPPPPDNCQADPTLDDLTCASYPPAPCFE
jgi:hypothetical protein